MISIDMKPTVTAYVSSKDRYFTTLPMAIAAIINQTLRPDVLVIYEDGEHVDLRENSIYKNLFSLANAKGIAWEVIYAQKKGQTLNHDHMSKNAKTEWIWRVDDDNIPEHNVLEILMSHIKDKEVGAIGGLVIDPKQIAMVPPYASNRIEDVYNAVNIQWFAHPIGSPVISVDHIYSTFLYRKEAGTHGYRTDLSPVGHREETIFTHEMKRAGWKLLIDPSAITWHVREPTGGIRSYNIKEYYDHDEEIFTKLMAFWKFTTARRVKLIVLDNGIGDHWMFKNILPEIKEKHKDKDILLAVCYPEVFEDEKDVTLISIADAKTLDSDMDKYNIYAYAWIKNWQGSLIDAFRGLYL